MDDSGEAPGWTSQFRVLINRLDLDLHDVRPFDRYHDPDGYTVSQDLGRRLRAEGGNGIVYRSVRCPDGDCAAIFWPDLIDVPIQGDHFDYHWDGRRVDRVRNCRTHAIFAL